MALCHATILLILWSLAVAVAVAAAGAASHSVTRKLPIAPALDELIARNTDAPWAPFPLLGIPFSDMDNSSTSSFSSPPGPFKVAFIADLLLRPEFDTAGRRLLHLVAQEKVDLTFLTGDLDYLEVGQHKPDRIGQKRTYPTTSLNMYESILGASHPIFTVFGNHEVESEVLFQPQAAFPKEPTYASVWHSRMERLRLNETCLGWVGGDSVCSVPGSPLLVVASNVAVADEPHRLPQRRYEHEQFVSTAFREYGGRARWRICQWHAPGEWLNTGNVPRSPQDDPGQRIYNACIKAGAIIATGHDHAYARTRSLRAPLRLKKNLKGHEEVATHEAPYYYEATASRAELLVLYEGSSFSFVNGLGGLHIRSPKRGKEMKTHWGGLKTATPTRAAELRDTVALLCTFGQIAPDKYFKKFPRTRDKFIQKYALPAKVAERISDLAEQSGWCILKTVEGKIEDKFAVLSVVSVGIPKPQLLQEVPSKEVPLVEPVAASKNAPSPAELAAESTPPATPEVSVAQTEGEKEVPVAPQAAQTITDAVDASHTESDDTGFEFKPIYVWLPSALILVPLLRHLLKGPPKETHAL